MAIVQISKIQQRAGNLVDLPQLDEAEFGWASDTKRLFIGKTTPNENIEVLTGYSEISFSQIDGSVGNLNINPLTVEDGQILTYDSTANTWVNRGQGAGGNINLGDVSNVHITGGAIGYVLETDGLGNLSWSPKSTIIAYIQNVTKASPGVITTTQDNFFTDAAEVTITDAVGMTQLNGNTYYVDVLTSNTFALYSDPGLSVPVNTSGYSTYAYTSVTGTTVATNVITVGNSALFSVNQPVRFIGDMSTSGIENDVTYYIKTKPSSTQVTISYELLPNGVAGNTLSLQTTSITANMYATGGRIVSAVGGSGTSGAQGSNTTVQFNNNNILDGDADFTWNFGASPKLLSVNGNANVGNLNSTSVVTASRFISNVATGTTPLQVTSTTRVANLNVAYANVADFLNITTASNSATYYPLFANGLTGNISEFANANLSFVPSTGTLSATLLTGTLTSPAQPNVTSVGTLSGLTVSGNLTSANANLGNLATANFFAGVLTTASQPNITSVGTLTSLTVTGTTTAGNLSTGGTLNVTGNSNVGNLGASGVIIATGNVTGGNLVTGGVVAATGNVTGGNLTTTGALNVTGNANVGNLGTAGLITATGNVTGGNLVTSGIANITGNVIAGNVYANSGTVGGSLLTGTLTTASQPNVTSVGTLTSLTVTGNVSAGNVSGTLLTGTLATAAQPNITSVGTLTSLTVTGNISGANVTGTHYGAATGLTSIPGANVTGTVANATYATSAGSATTATSATTAGTVTTAAQPNITSVGTLTSLSISGSLTTTDITTGANTTVGNITGNWTLTSGSRMQATYADLAEYYESDQMYEPGTVLEFGGDKEVTLATDGTKRVAGVISTNPAYAMNSQCPGHAVAIALQGRVPVKVRGIIRKGDMLISGGNGFARPDSFPSIGTVIGKALENWDGGEGVIEVAVGRI